MICPQCNIEFDAATDGRLPSHNCPSCGGTWIRGQALHSLIAKTGDPTGIERTLDQILTLDYRTSQRRCPSCRHRFLKVVVIENTELDFCGSCKGLFFDPGELARVFPGILEQTAGPGRRKHKGFWASLLKFIDQK